MSGRRPLRSSETIIKKGAYAQALSVRLEVVLQAACFEQ